MATEDDKTNDESTRHACRGHLHLMVMVMMIFTCLSVMNMCISLCLVPSQQVHCSTLSLLFFSFLTFFVLFLFVTPERHCSSHSFRCFLFIHVHLHSFTFYSSLSSSTTTSSLIHSLLPSLLRSLTPILSAMTLSPISIHFNARSPLCR